MEEMTHGRQKVRVIQAPASPDEIRAGIPFRIGDGAQQGISYSPQILITMFSHENIP
jgi:hypothetical protein